MHHKKILMSIVTLIIALSSPALAQAEEQKVTSPDSQVVAKIGDREIKFADLNNKIKMMPPTYQSMFNNIEQMKKLLDVQINSILFSQEAKRLKLDQKTDIKEKIEEITNGILMQALVEEKINKNITVTDQEIEEYYKNSQDEFKTPEKVKVRHILFKVDPAASAQVKEEKKAKAKEVLAKVRAGEDFSELAKQYSEDTKTKNKGGVIGLFARGSKDPEFDKSAFSLKKDEVSDLILTKKGYHIIKLLDKKEAKTKSLKEATNRIRNKLKQKKRRDGYEELLKDLKAETKVVIHEDALAKIVEGLKGPATK